MDAMNFYFESKNLKDINEAQFITLYADEAENSSHKETFSMFVTYYSFKEEKVVTSFLGIVNLKGKKAAEIMDVIKKFFEAKSINLGKVFFSVLDGTNSMSGKNNGLQRHIRFYSPFNLYINCRNHRLALCLPHLMKDPYLGELLVDYDTLLLCLWKMFHYSPKKNSILENIQTIYGKKQLKILKAAVTRWLTHGKASQRVLDCFEEILATIDHICIDTNESEARGVRNLLINNKMIFFICLMSDVLAVLNTLSLGMQKQGILLVDIKHLKELAVEKLKKMHEAKTSNEFKDVLFPATSYYANYQKFLAIIGDFQVKRKKLRQQGKQIEIENFHQNISKVLLAKLIVEVEEAFDMSDFPILDAFHTFDPRNIPETVANTFGMEEAKLIHKFYGNSKVNIFKEQRNEVSPVIKCNEETFLVQCSQYFQLVTKKKSERSLEYQKQLEQAENKLHELEKKKRSPAKAVKILKQEVEILSLKVKQPLPLEQTIKLTSDILPDVAIILNIISICPASGAVVERGFSLMNLIMNDLRNSMNIRTLDAIMRIHYNGQDLSDEEADNIISVWKRRGNRRIEL